MDPNPFVNPPIGFILLGLVLVLLLAATIYAIGAWGAARMRRSRIEDSSAIPYPEQPHSDDDRETVQHVHAREQSPDRVVTPQQLDELAVGDRKIVPQTPARGDRPVDAVERDKNLHQVRARPSDGTSPAQEQGQGGESGQGGQGDQGPDPL